MLRRLDETVLEAPKHMQDERRMMTALGLLSGFGDWIIRRYPEGNLELLRTRRRLHDLLPDAWDARMRRDLGREGDQQLLSDFLEVSLQAAHLEQEQTQLADLYLRARDCEDNDDLLNPVGNFDFNDVCTRRWWGKYLRCEPGRTGRDWEASGLNFGDLWAAVNAAWGRVPGEPIDDIPTE